MFSSRAVPALTASARHFSSSSARASFARLTLAGNLIESPVRKSTQSGKDFYLIRVATSDPPGPAGPDGQPTRSSTFHSIFSFKNTDKEWVTQIPKGSLVHIDCNYTKKGSKQDDGTFKEETLLKLESMHVLKRNNTEPHQELE